MRKIVAVFGGSGDESVAGLLGSLVSGRQADVAGVFLEDSTLFRLAELPFVTEVCRITTVRRPLTTRELERQMKVLALRAEQAVRMIAERAGSRWTFRKHRGRLTTALAETAEVDLLLIGTTRWALASSGEVQATARTLRAAEAEAKQPVVVLFDESAASGRAVDAGVELADRTGRSLIVFVPAKMAEAPPDLGPRLAPLGPKRATIRSVTSSEPSTLLSAIRRAAPAVLVVGADEAGFEESRIGALRAAFRCPMMVVR
jgi:hypothetical protein